MANNNIEVMMQKSEAGKKRLEAMRQSSYKLTDIKQTPVVVGETDKTTGTTNDTSNAVVGKTVGVDPSVVFPGSLVKIGDETYVAVADTTAVSPSTMKFPVSDAATALSEGNKTVEAVVYPPGSDTTMTDSGSLKAETAESVKEQNKATTAASTASSGTSSIVGAGADSGEGIIDFATFTETLAFKEVLSQKFSEDGTYSVHEYLSSCMQKFYHQLYYIPNLKNNYVIVVKPENLFINAPSCNLIFPNIKASISYSRPYKQEPTRLLQISDPVAQAYGQSSGPMCLTCLMFTEEEKTGTVVNGLPMYRTYVTSLGVHTSLNDKIHPLQNLTSYEERNGIRCSTVNKGADLYLFLKSAANSTVGGTSSTTSKSSSANSDSYQISIPAGEQEGVGQTLGRLAQYELYRQRYVLRTGSLDMYFNPYIVPGFPFISIETSTGGLNIYGYVTDVAHNITERSWTTTINFNCAHSDYENSPGAYPIIESEYASKLADTYKDMLGDDIVPVKNTDIQELISTYGNDRTFMTTSYRKIWRETPSLDDYLSNVADGAKLIEEDDYWWFENGSGSSFFNTEVQARIKEYTKSIINDQLAMNNEDVR